MAKPAPKNLKTMTSPNTKAPPMRSGPIKSTTPEPSTVVNKTYVKTKPRGK